MVEVLWEETPTARQHHECSTCGRTINPGEQYRRTRCIFDGEAPYTVKECAHCRAFLRLYLDQICPDPYDGWTEDDLTEWQPATPEAVEHKRRWSIGWRRGRDLYPIPDVLA